MADQLPDVEGGAGAIVEAGPVAAVGYVSTINSFTGSLEADEPIEGEYETNNYEHVGVNVLADQDGTLTLEFSWDGGANIALTVTIPVYANQPRFRTLIKLPGRSVRATYTNGSGGTANVTLKMVFGNALFPAAASPDGELLITETERERDVWVNYGKSNVQSSGYVLLIDKSDNVNWPHDELGRIDLTSVSLSVDRENNSVGYWRIGVITRIDGTNADVRYVRGITFAKSDERAIIRDRRESPTQIKLSIVDGELTRILTNFKEDDVAALNTATPIESVTGTNTIPGLGDVIAAYSVSTAQSNLATSISYHAEVADA